MRMYRMNGFAGTWPLRRDLRLRGLAARYTPLERQAIAQRLGRALGQYLARVHVKRHAVTEWDFQPLPILARGLEHVARVAYVNKPFAALLVHAKAQGELIGGLAHFALSGDSLPTA